MVFFTTEHYRDAVEATGARFVPFAAEDDAHDLMVANPERESSSKRGVRGVKDDLRRIFIGPLPGQCRDLRAILDGFAADCIVVDSMFLGALPLALGPRAARPALACIGVMPYASNSRDTAPFGVAFQPGTDPLRRLRNGVMNWATEHFVLADIQRFARRRLAEAGAPEGFPGYFIDLQPKVVDAYLQATVAGFEYPRSDLAPRCASSGPSWRHRRAPSSSRPGGTSSRATGRSSTSPRARSTTPTSAGSCSLTTRALARDDVLVVATTGGPDPEPLRRACRRNVRLERFIPHDLLLPHVDVMVTNGGYGGVQQALAHGVPLVVAGDSEDKPEVAARVQWSGAGINLHTGRPSPAMVARAVRRVLARPSYRQRAQALQAEIAATDPLGTISGVLAELCTANEVARRAETV